MLCSSDKVREYNYHTLKSSDYIRLLDGPFLWALTQDPGLNKSFVDVLLIIFKHINLMTARGNLDTPKMEDLEGLHEELVNAVVDFELMTP
mmetsp:Transcript_33983/g.47078  ORF Transcript_33983/g.47078 Transcript_33983/m.47078 type:complete len:91 (-) Transcript_33983:281-553(-)